MNLNDKTRTLTVTEISNLLQITPAGVTHLINPLEQAGYIERLRAPNDRRVILIGLTDRGVKNCTYYLNSSLKNAVFMGSRK